MGDHPLKKYHFETNAIREQIPHGEQREHSSPVFLTSSFIFESAEQARALFAEEMQGNIYSRFSNPNTEEFIRKMCALEGAEDGVATATGMSAVFTSMAALLESGNHVVCARSVFGSTHQILSQIFPRWGIKHTYVDITPEPNWEKYILPETKLVFVETPSNPSLDIIDLEKLSKVCNQKNVLLNVDNCFATPYLQRPLEYGAHIITHSATKYIDGQGRVLGGIILGDKATMARVRFFARHSGPALSPFSAWILSKSLETLAIRMEKHCENALAIAQFLENRPEVEKVIYPFLPSHKSYELARKQMKKGGGMVSFLIKGGLEKGREFLDSLKMVSHTANLGDTRTIATHPASTTHSKLAQEDQEAVGIYPGLVRISAGLEHISDILNDIGQALLKK